MWEFYIERIIMSLPSFLRGLWVTIQVSGVSLILGTLLGTAAGILRTRTFKPARLIITAYVDVARGTPYLIQVFIFFFILPEWGLRMEAFKVAVLSLTLYAGACICEIVACGIESVSVGQWEAAKASGFNWLQQMQLVILPQALRAILPPLVGQYVLLIKESSIVSVIGLMDVTRVGWLTAQRIPEGLMVFGLVGALYFCICYPLIQLSVWFERRLTIREINR